MTARRRRGPRRLGAACGLITGLCAGVAGRSVDAEGAPLEEIVVTARKLPESLYDVPLKIDVLAGADLIEAGSTELQNVAARVPGLYYESTWGGVSSAPTIRSQPQNPGGDLSVGVFVDGVYQANPTAIDTAPIDLDRIEVVRGPQSALFGHSTFAGAIHYVSRKPTDTVDTGLVVETGSDDYRGASGFVSGPLGEHLLGRVAVGWREFGGTQRTVQDGELGGWRRSALALTLATPQRSNRFQATLTVRAGERAEDQAPAAALTYKDYNCGAIEALSHAWSYYCGPLPRSVPLEISAAIPDSDTDVIQAALTLSWPTARGGFESQTSVYRGETDAYRDFDASTTGATFGVCTLGSNCPTAGGVPRAIDRLIDINEVSLQLELTREWSQELRWRHVRSERLEWTLGGAVWQTDDRAEGRLGAAREDLAVNQRLTALLPATPFLVGPLALANSALVIDPNAEQRTQALDETERESLAVFGIVDYDLSGALSIRAELRASHERRSLVNEVANFAPGFGSSIAPQDFDDVTPRASIRYAPSMRWSGYASAAKGSQSGGINPVPGLLPSEQTFEPEYNWTYELGGRFRDADGRIAVAATAYYVDWRNAQLPGFPGTPGVANLITLNTAGLRTRGLEVSIDARPLDALRIALDLFSSDPEFREGSDDPGSRRFCGLSGANTTSSFCTIGPSRAGLAPGTALVPYIDGNVPARVPTNSWHTGFAVDIPVPHDGAHLTLHIDANGQNDVFERSIDGARFGARTLVDARLDYAFGAWSLELWGRNLGDEPYVRAASSRGQIHFPTTPRPLDLIYAEGRRIGVTATFAPALLRD